jgi:type I restriction enzyme S subunit
LDKKIEHQQKKIEVLKMYKKGLLLKEFSNKSKNILLGEILKVGKAGGTPKSTNKDYYNGEIPFLSISDMTNQGKYIIKTEKKISKIGLKNSSAWILPENTIILSMYASYGLVAINKINLATSQAMFNMIFIDNVDTEYIYYYLNYLKEIHYYDSIVSQGTQPNLNADKVRKTLIYLPTLKEQNEVSKLFIMIDKKINVENEKMKKILKLKYGLLQQMFI